MHIVEPHTKRRSAKCTLYARQYLLQPPGIPDIDCKPLSEGKGVLMNILKVKLPHGISESESEITTLNFRTSESGITTRNFRKVKVETQHDISE